MADPSKCSWMLCKQPGLFRCSRCREATPPTIYCSEKCQKSDWKFHKTFCGKHAYTFELTLVGSSNPVVKRTFDVPSWYTFEMLHYTIQYGMGPWQNCHLHEFEFRKPAQSSQTSRPSGLFDGWLSEKILRIIPRMEFAEQERRAPLEEEEETLLLSDVYEPSGRLHTAATPGGTFEPLFYIYDMGDNWVHKLTYKGKKLARADRPLFSVAQGCGPVEDCGGIYGWNELKKAFRTPAASRKRDQRENITWAQERSGLGEAFNPLKDPNVVQMNYEGRWENHLRAFKNLPDDDFGGVDSDEMFRDSSGDEEIEYHTGLAIVQDDEEIEYRTGLAIVQDDEEFEYRTGVAIVQDDEEIEYHRTGVAIVAPY